MYENYFMLDGKKIPMSDETRDSLREAQKTELPNKIKEGDILTMEREDWVLVKINGTWYLKSGNVVRGNGWDEGTAVGIYGEESFLPSHALQFFHLSSPTHYNGKALC